MIHTLHTSLNDLFLGTTLSHATFSHTQQATTALYCTCVWETQSHSRHLIYCNIYTSLGGKIHYENLLNLKKPKPMYLNTSVLNKTLKEQPRLIPHFKLIIRATSLIKLLTTRDKLNTICRVRITEIPAKETQQLYI